MQSDCNALVGVFYIIVADIEISNLKKKVNLSSMSIKKRIKSAAAIGGSEGEGSLYTKGLFLLTVKLGAYFYTHAGICKFLSK